MFVRKVAERVNDEQPFSKQWWNTADVKLQWEAAQEAQVEATCCALGLPDDDEQLVSAENLVLDGDGCVGRVRAWLARQRRLFGRREFRVGDLRAIVREAVHQGRLYSRGDGRHLAAMTIHQAKNREFDRVIVLWPYEVSGDDERKRRLAYNAITRARHEAFVIVQNEDRVACSPFVPGVNPAPKTSKRLNQRKTPATTSEHPDTGARRSTRPGKGRNKASTAGESR